MEESDLLAPVPTRAALLKQNKIDEFKAQVFEVPRLSKNGIDSARKKHWSEDDNSEQKKEKKNGEGPEFDMKRARHEVFNFGLTGFKSKNKRKAQIALAVKLGAKAPKKMYKNYKELLEEKQRTKQMKEERMKMRQLGKNQTGAASVRHKKPKPKKPKGGLGEISQHYGVANPKLKKKKIK